MHAAGLSMLPTVLGEGGLSLALTPWSAAWSVLILLAVAGVGIAGWRRTGWQWRFGGLELLRWLIALVVVVLLNEPEWVVPQPPGEKPSVAVLVDASPSMGTADVSVPGAAARTREQAVTPLGDAAFWSPVAERFDVRVTTFGGRGAGGGESGGQSGGEAGGEAGTDLFTPLESVTRQHSRLRAVVLVSDGDWNQGQPPVEAATALRLAGVPVLAVPVGSPIPLPDVALASLDCPTLGVAGKPVRIPFTLRSTLPREQAVTVDIEVSDGQRLSKAVRLASMGQTHDWVYWTPQATGDFTVKASLPVLPEEVVPENNTRSAPISIRQEKLRVLVVESLPRWEYRYLRNALSRDPGVEVSCLLFHPDLKKVGGGNPDYIRQFPATLEELASYDVVFLGDVGMAADQLTEDDCRRLRGLIEFQASGLVFMPGWLGRQATLADSPLGDLLPVVVDAGRPEGTGSASPARMVLTELGRRSLLTRLADTVDENAAVWDALPGFQWFGPVLRAKAGSEVLAVHEMVANEYGRVPLLVTRTFGAGKVLYMATDGAWRWRKGVEDKYHYRFWGQVVRWMAYRRNMATGQHMRLLFSPEQPQQGQTVTLDANVSDATGEPLQRGTVTVTFTPEGGQPQTLRLTAPGPQSEWGVFSGTWTPEVPGPHTVVLACAETGDRLEASIFVQGTLGETVGGAARPDVLEEIARVTRGQVVEPRDLDRVLASIQALPDEPPQVRRIRLWTHPAVLVTLTLLLCTFWIGRKWLGLI